VRRKSADLLNHRPGAPREETTVNILFITADQWRGDAVGYAGRTPVKTPNVDAFAEEAVVFLNHFSQASPCSPARAALYTGLYQMNNRVCRNGTPLDARFDNIARAARRAGYDPTLFGYTDQSADPRHYAPDDPWLRTYEGVLPGFTLRARLPEDERQWLSWLGARGTHFADSTEAHRPVGVPRGTISDAPPAYGADETQTAYLTDEWLRWHSEQDRTRPWFAHLSYLRPHPPFIVPAPYNTLINKDQVPGFQRAKSPEAEAALHPLLECALSLTPAASFVRDAPGLVRDLPDAAFRQIRATYYGMVAEVDAQLGRVFTALKQTGQWDDTIIILTSDHAEMLGDHYALGKGGFHDQSQHVPLVLRVPGAVEGRRVEAFTEAVDLFPTLLDLLGVAPLHHPDGQSLRAFLGDTPPEPWRDAVHWEFDFRDVEAGTTETWFGLGSAELNLAVVRTKTWKYVHFQALPPLLFNLVDDPAECINLAEDPAHLKTRLLFAEKLLAWRARHLDQTLALQQLTPAGVRTGTAERTTP
jgi:arylsulfatase A-like enzyme